MPIAKVDHEHLESQRKAATQQLAQLHAKALKTDGCWPADNSYNYFVGIMNTLAQSLESLSIRIADLEQKVD